MQNVITCLGFNNQAEEAVNLYTSVIKNSKILSMVRHGDAGPGPKGSLLVATFLLDGQEFMALNGGPPFTFTMGMSIVRKCETQAEIDELWERLSEGGQKIECGWLTDRFGVSWQIVPAALGQWMSDPQKAPAVLEALMQMKKLDIATLQQAYDQAGADERV
jgi:predicted 3-demethylubiquinone-9 3-methyltransferase (glyoxalase superfamily)